MGCLNTLFKVAGIGVLLFIVLVIGVAIGGGDIPAPEAPSARPEAPSARPEAPSARPGDDGQYALTVLSEMSKYEDSFTRLGQLMGRADVDDAAWRLEVKSQCREVRRTGEAIISLTPPQDFVQVHGHLVSAANNFTSACLHIETGIDTLNIGSLEEASRLLQAGARDIEIATNLLTGLYERGGA